MRAVTGEIVSSQPISLSKAAAVLSRFAASETGARQDVAAYLSRASTAFEELVSVHQEIRAQRKMSLLEEEEVVAPQEEDDSSRKKTKKKKGMYYEADEAVEYSILERQAERDSGGRKKVKVLGPSHDERFPSAMLEANGTVDVKKEWDEEKSIVGIVEKANGAVEKKKKDKKKEVDEKRKDKVKIEERRKKKEKKTKEGRIEEDFDSKNMDRKWKKRRHSDVEQGGVNGEMEQHEGEKKKKRRSVE